MSQYVPIYQNICFVGFPANFSQRSLSWYPEQLPHSGRCLEVKTQKTTWVKDLLGRMSFIQERIPGSRNEGVRWVRQEGSIPPGTAEELCETTQSCPTRRRWWGWSGPLRYWSQSSLIWQCDCSCICLMPHLVEGHQSNKDLLSRECLGVTYKSMLTFLRIPEGWTDKVLILHLEAAHSASCDKDSRLVKLFV